MYAYSTYHEKGVLMGLMGGGGLLCSNLLSTLYIAVRGDQVKLSLVTQGFIETYWSIKNQFFKFSRVFKAHFHQKRFARFDTIGNITRTIRYPYAPIMLTFYVTTSPLLQIFRKKLLIMYSNSHQNSVLHSVLSKRNVLCSS